MQPTGNVSPDLGGFNWFANGSWWPEIGRPVYQDKVSPYSAAIMALFAADSVNLSLTWYGSGVDTGHGGNSMYGMPYNVVPGTQPLVPVTYVLYPGVSDAGPVPLYGSVNIEDWPGDALDGGGSGNTWITGLNTATVSHGSATVTGSSTTFLSRVLAGDVISFAKDSTLETAQYTVLSVSSNTVLTLTTTYAGSLTSGVVIAGPFNRPPKAAYLGSTDYHSLVAVRDESTPTLIKYLWELYTVSSEDGGANWSAAAGSKWNMETGAQRTDGASSTAVSGLPIMPLLVTYPDAAANRINHPLRLIIGPGYGQFQQYVWPALFGLGAGKTGIGSGLPAGGRIRLKNSWYQANLASFSPINQAILNALRTYGAIVTDGGQGATIDGTNDDRWNEADLANLRVIPIATAFEVVDTIKPQMIFNGPLVGASSAALHFSAGYAIAANQNFGNVEAFGDFTLDLRLYYSTDGGTTYNDTGATAQPITDANHSPGPGPFTMSWSPPSAGTYLHKLQFSTTNWMPQPPISVTVYTAGSTHTRTSTRDGNWATGSTWVGGTAPVAGDYVVIAHNVMITADTLIGDGSSATVLTCTAGTLTVTGAVLTICGASSWGAYNSGTVVTRLTVQPNGSTPAGVVLDGKATVAPIFTVFNDTSISFLGTTSARVFFRTNPQTAGLPGYVTATDTLRVGYMAATYCDFANLGTSSIPGWAAILAQVTSGPHAFSMAHCTVDNCGLFPSAVITDGGIVCSLTDSQWTNPIDADHAFNISVGSGVTITTGTRIVSKCMFHGAQYPNWGDPCGFTITDNFFDQSMFASHGNTDVWASFDGNFARKEVNLESQCDGDITNNFWLCTAYSRSYHNITKNHDSLVLGNIYQYTGATGVQMLAIAETEGGTVDHTVTIRYNITLPNGLDTSCEIAGLVSNTLDSVKVNSIVEHNTLCVGEYLGAQAGSTVGQKVGTILSFQGNLFWRDGAPLSGTYALLNSDPSPMPDIVTAANCDYNGWNNLATVPGGTWSDVADGTVYSSPMSGVVHPGVHDHASTDPQFYDKTRNLQTWAIMKGVTNATDTLDEQVFYGMQELQTDLTLTKTDLIPWVRAGWRPTNSAVAAGSFPTDPSTTDAAGNAWPSSPPGLGAMAETSAPPAPNTLSVGGSNKFISVGGRSYMVTAS